MSKLFSANEVHDFVDNLTIIAKQAEYVELMS